MDISISNPINISMDLLEIDKHLPSIKFDIKINVKKFGYSLVVNTQIWIECSVFDLFIEAMRKGEIARLMDINRLFELTIDVAQNRLQWFCAKENLDACITLAKGEEMLTNESRDIIYSTFNDYPRWW
ncbi:hypothetical protein [Stenoxybacter acetivorans]|uniref:hypothetical protein n=1 Tax=Stenoxybacter acetivorans TaxID=422441 RepID=UPI0012ECB92D|nr:hypothetical protein [Stenoxybacter acetivorans]